MTDGVSVAVTVAVTVGRVQMRIRGQEGVLRFRGWKVEDLVYVTGFAYGLGQRSGLGIRPRHTPAFTVFAVLLPSTGQGTSAA